MKQTHKLERKIVMSAVITLLVVSGLASFQRTATNYSSAASGPSILVSGSNQTDGYSVLDTVNVPSGGYVFVFVLSANTKASIAISDPNDPYLIWTDCQQWRTTWTGYGEMAEACAQAGSGSLTIEASQNVQDNINIIVMVVSGVCWNSFGPWAGVSFTTGDSKTPSKSISYSQSNDMLLGILAVQSKPSISPGSQFTIIQTANKQAPSSSSEYYDPGTSGSETVKFGLGTIENWDLMTGVLLGSGDC